MQKLTSIAFFAETTQPVLAYDCLFVLAVLEDAVWAVWTHSTQVVLACLGTLQTDTQPFLDVTLKVEFMHGVLIPWRKNLEICQVNC